MPTNEELQELYNKEEARKQKIREAYAKHRESLTPEQRSENARKAVEKRWKNYKKNKKSKIKTNNKTTLKDD